MKKILQIFLLTFCLLIFTINATTVYAGDPCIECKEFQNKYSFLIPENFILDHVEGGFIINNGNINPPLDIIFFVTLIVSILIISYGFYILYKKKTTNKGRLIILIGIILILFSFWVGLNLDFFLKCSYASCDIRL